MKIKEAIILAGGLGTRLRSAVPELPKVMAPILAKPFIGYLLDYYQQQGIQRFILALGYKYELVEQYLHTQYGHLDILFTVEAEPLGTGGALKLASEKVNEKTVLVLNGDTFFKIDLNKLLGFHEMCGADCTLSLKPMADAGRYGLVALKKDYSITAFTEQGDARGGLINGGVYALNAPDFRMTPFPPAFSFEKDYLQQNLGLKRFYGVVQDEYFIDIGIPEDFEKAQTELILNSRNDRP